MTYKQQKSKQWHHMTFMSLIQDTTFFPHTRLNKKVCTFTRNKEIMDILSSFKAIYFP